MTPVGQMPLQLLEHATGEGRTALDVIENPEGLRPPWFDDNIPDHAVPRIGTSSILRIAKLLSEQGFRIVRFELYDSRYGMLSDDDADEISLQLRSILMAGGVASANGFLHTDAAGVNVAGVALHAPDGSRATLRRNGVLISLVDSVTTKALQEVWPAVRR